MLSANTIRNINILGTNENCQQTMLALKSDHICADSAILSIKEICKCSLTIKCNTPESAINVENAIRSREFSRTYKIWTSKHRYSTNDEHFIIDRIYEVNTDMGSYRNLIITTNINMQKLILKKGFIIFGFCECKC